jgi:hypothetical protein
VQDVSPELLDTLPIDISYFDLLYRDVQPLLAANGRTDLVRVLEYKSRESRRYHQWQLEQDWKGAVKRFDRKWFGETLFRSYRGLRSAWMSSRSLSSRG